MGVGMIGESVPTQEEESSARALGLPVMALRILMAAMELFARKGYAATSVREIVQRANVTNPMLYYYFESKEGVFHKLIDILFQSMEQRVEEVLARVSGGSLEEQLYEVVRIHLEVARESPEALQFIYSVLFGPRQGRPDVDPIKMRQGTLARVTLIFERAMERGEFVPRAGYDAMFLTLQLFGMINQHMMFTLTELSRAGEGDETSACMAQLLLGPEVIERMLDFYFGGAGQLKASAAGVVGREGEASGEA